MQLGLFQIKLRFVRFITLLKKHEKDYNDDYLIRSLACML